MNNITLEASKHMNIGNGSGFDILSLDNKVFVDLLVNKIKPLQDSLNKKMCGDDYATTGVTNKGKLIRYDSAIVSELNELLDSTPWKHWGKIDAVPDMENIEVELVDLLHFTASELLMCDGDEGITSKMLSRMVSASNNVEWTPHLTPVLDIGSMTIVDAVETYVFAMLASLLKARSRRGQTLVNSSIYHGMSIMTILLHSKLYELDIGKSMDRLWTLYQAKNALNILRSANGYKEGTYIKTWNGIEDNKVVMQIITDNSPLVFTDLVSTLQAYYDDVVASNELIANTMDGDIADEYVDGITLPHRELIRSMSDTEQGVAII